MRMVITRAVVGIARPLLLSAITAFWTVNGFAAEPLPTEPFEAPKFGVTTEIPKAWPLLVRERDAYVFVAQVPQDDPERPGIVACELALAPESLDEYRTRIDATAERGGRPGGTLARNEVVTTPEGQERLETIWEFRPRGLGLWREVTVRVVANCQLYAFILNVNDDVYDEVRAAFDTMIDTTVFTTPDTGTDRIDEGSNRWAQREFRFALELPDDWQPALAPAEIALFYANGPAHGIWADNVLVVAQPKGTFDLPALAEALPNDLKRVDPDSEVLACEIVHQGGDGAPREALETVIRTRRGPFTMIILERRFHGDRFDYEVKYTLEEKRFEDLAPTLRQSLDSFEELPGAVEPGAGPDPTRPA